MIKLQTNRQPKRLHRQQQQQWVTSAAPLRFLISRAFCFFAVCQLFFFELNPPLTEPAGDGTSEHVQRKPVAAENRAAAVDGAVACQNDARGQPWPCRASRRQRNKQTCMAAETCPAWL